MTDRQRPDHFYKNAANLDFLLFANLEGEKTDVQRVWLEQKYIYN
jgi:hypothetical protein